MSDRRSPCRETLSDHALDRMLSDGWTPNEVRALIQSYRELRDELGYVGNGFVQPKQREQVVRRHCFEVVERELRECGVREVHLHEDSVELVREGCGRDSERKSLAKAFEGLKGEI